MRKNTSMRARFLLMAILFLSFILIFRFLGYINYCDYQLENMLGNCSYIAESVSRSFENCIDMVWAFEELAISKVFEGNALPVSKGNLDAIYRNGIECINLYDKDGNNIFTFPQSHRSFAMDDLLDDFKKGKEKVIAVDYDDSGESCIWAVRAIKEKETVKGIAAACIDTQILYEHMRFTDYGNTDYYYALIDNNGKVINCVNTYDTPVFSDDAGKIQPNNVNNAVVLRSLVSNIPLSVYSDFPIEDTGWSFRIFINPQTIKTGLIWMIRHDMLILALFAAFSAMAYILLDKDVLKPLSQLSSTTIKVMNGEYSARSRLDGYHELKTVGENLDKMLDSLEHNQYLKTQIFMNIYHDIKNPLNVIFASIQLMENYKSIDNPEVFKSKILVQVKLIRQNCYRLMRLTRNLIDINKHDNGYLKMKLSNHDMVKLVKGITDSVKRYTELKGIRLLFISELESIVMACDPDMIERIILNLISNAIKFTDRGGSITVGIRQPNPGGNVLITVSDTGIGIPKDKINSIFDRFKQVDDIYHRNKEGSGLGLSVVKAFVEAHQGKISVESELMKGTTFYISLPVKTVEDTSQTLPKSDFSSDLVSCLNIEFSDIYTGFEDEIP